MFWWDPTYIVIFPALAFAMWAQAKVQGTFARFARVGSRRGMRGADVAREILDSYGLADVRIEQIPQHLGDHYDPRARVLRLSPQVYGSSSLAALGVAAHESGHAVQHATGYMPLAIRTSLVPVANLGSSLAFPLFFIGFIFAQSGLSWLMTLGIWIFVGVVAFSIVTLPVEYNASRRALAALDTGGYLTGEELVHAREVLNAAALTYVAAVAVAVTQLLRLLILRGSRRD
ncbi:MAG TPA: zinc metallopeptidase [Firmicutes bacterium]|nr:zinc metallopeptidase [Bacillota bacterium]